MKWTGNSGSDLCISYWQAGTSTQVEEEWRKESRKQMRRQDRSSTSDFPKSLKAQSDGGVHLGSNGCSPRLHSHSNRQLPRIFNHSSW